MPFSRPGDDYISVGNANDQRYQIAETRRKNLKGKSLDNDFNYLIQTANDLEVQIGNVIAGSIPGTDEIENKDKALITDGEGNIGLTFIDSQNLAERAVEERHHGDASVSNRVLQKGIVTGDNVADRTLPTRVHMKESVTGDIIAKKTVDYSHLRPGAGKGDFFAPKGIPTEAYGDRSIPTSAIALGAVGRDQLSAEVTAGLSNIYGPVGHYLDISYPGPPPANYLDSVGSRLLRSEYPELFALWGTMYGGSGLYFMTPDWRGRSGFYCAPGTTETGGPFGGRITGATASNLSLGGTGGAETHSLTSAQNASHSHLVDTKSITYASLTEIDLLTTANPAFQYRVVASLRESVGYPDPLKSVSGNSGSSGSGAPHNNMPPFIFARRLVRVK